MAAEDLFSQGDKALIAARGLSVEQVMEQIGIFREGAVPVKLNRPCTIDDGIRVIGEEEGKVLVGLHDEEARPGRMFKFVPASGAASRMFKDWYQILDVGGLEDGARRQEFLTALRNYAFVEDLQAKAAEGGWNLEELVENGRICDILSLVLTAEGLNYGQLPKALLPFHRYPEGSRTAIEEHFVEAALYVKDDSGKCRLHFTVSAEHEKAVAAFLKQVAGTYEKRFEATFELSLSVQHAHTDTVAVDLNGEPFRDEKGALVFRPGGHGALLENLDSLAGNLFLRRQACPGEGGGRRTGGDG